MLKDEGLIFRVKSIVPISSIVLLLFFSLVIMNFGALSLAIILVSLSAIYYYYYSFKNEELIIYPIAFSIFLGSTLSVFEGNSIPLTPFQITLVLGVLVFLLSRTFKKDTIITYNGLFIPVIAFLSIISFSLIYSPDNINGTLQLIRFIVLIIFCHLTSIIVKKRKTIEKIFLLVLLVSIALSIYSVIENALNPQIAIQNLLTAGTKLTRSTAGAFSDPNRFASILIFPIAISFTYLNSNKPTRIRIIAGICFLLLFAGLLSTYSRSGFLAILVLVTIIIFRFNKVRLFIVLATIGLAIGLLIPSIRINIFVYSERILDLFSGSFDSSNSIRIMLGIGAISMFIESYTFGVGFQGFNEAFQRYFSYQETITVQEPHNIIYTILAELGIIGFIVFSFLVYSLFKKAISNLKKSEAEDDRIISVIVVSSMFAYAVFYQFYDGALLDTSLMMIIGIMLAHQNMFTTTIGSKEIS